MARNLSLMIPVLISVLLSESAFCPSVESGFFSSPVRVSQYALILWIANTTANKIELPKGCKWWEFCPLIEYKQEAIADNK